MREWVIQKVGGYSPVITWYRAKRPRWLWRLTSPFGKPTSRYIEQNGLTVKRGAFSGLKFPESAIGHSNYLGAKIAGTYEPPVVSFLAEQATESELFVDLGSSDGFFLTAVARMNRDKLRAIGYEINPWERTTAQRLAALNGVTIETRERATSAELASLPAGRLLLLCDLEGLEEDLLDPDSAPRLRDATMAVEVHEMFRPDVATTLTRRFAATHEIARIAAEPSDPKGIPELLGWDPGPASLVCHDGHERGEGWMTFVPKPV